MKKYELRACFVDGRKALFHKWVTHDKVLLNFKAHINTYIYSTIRETFDKYGVTDDTIEPLIVQTIYGLVEFEDGIVDLVEPKSIKFADNATKEYCWKE